jgi:peptidoglycan/xylan/chitin deacetylase (PgdA/CDA1 family)
VNNGSIDQLLKSLAFFVLGSDLAIASRISVHANSEAVTILNFHRVDDRERSTYEAIDPALFDELVSWLKQRFTVVTFEELSTCKRGVKPFLILSFDDGYKDFIDIVVPIVEKHRVRVNQNLIPTALETGLPPMNVQLQDFIQTAPAALLREIPLPGLPRGADPENRVRSGRHASEVFKNRPIEEQKKIFTKLQPEFQRFDGFHTTPVMSVEEARQIATVHEIGSHSFEHANMAEETDAYLRDDIDKCFDYFQTQLKIRPIVYAFANGSARPEQTEVIRAAGFRHVLLTGDGFSHRSNWLHKRFTMFAKTMAEAKFRALGGLKSPPKLRGERGRKPDQS